MNKRHGDLIGVFSGEVKRAPEWFVWSAMKSRCTNPNATAYHNYGGRGIKVCDRWLTYANFINDMGRRPTPQHTIDRINNDGDYEPSNCRWATCSEQNRNRRMLRLEREGKKLSVRELASAFGVCVNTIRYRMKAGWTVEQIASTPAHKDPRRDRPRRIRASNCDS